MLILSRKEKEQVVIGDPNDIIGTVTIIRIGGGQVRLGFDFPRSIPVNRIEVNERVRQETNRDGD